MSGSSGLREEFQVVKAEIVMRHNSVPEIREEMKGELELMRTATLLNIKQ